MISTDTNTARSERTTQISGPETKPVKRLALIGSNPNTWGPIERLALIGSNLNTWRPINDVPE